MPGTISRTKKIKSKSNYGLVSPCSSKLLNPTKNLARNKILR